MACNTCFSPGLGSPLAPPMPNGLSSFGTSGSLGVPLGFGLGTGFSSGISSSLLTGSSFTGSSFTGGWTGGSSLQTGTGMAAFGTGPTLPTGLNLGQGTLGSSFGTGLGSETPSLGTFWGSGGLAGFGTSSGSPFGSGFGTGGLGGVSPSFAAAESGLGAGSLGTSNFGLGTGGFPVGSGGLGAGAGSLGSGGLGIGGSSGYSFGTGLGASSALSSFTGGSSFGTGLGLGQGSGLSLNGPSLGSGGLGLGLSGGLGFGGASSIPPPLPILQSTPTNVPVTSFPITSTSYDVRPAPPASPSFSPSFSSSSFNPCMPNPCMPNPCQPVCAPAPAPAPIVQREVEIRVVETGGEKVKVLEEELGNLRHHLSLAEDTQERLRRQLQEAQVKVKVWAQKEGQVASLESEIARLKEQIFENDLKLVNSEGQRAGAADQVLKLEREVQSLHIQLQKAQALEVELQAMQAQLQEARQRLVTMEGENGRYQSGMSHLEAQLSESQDRLFQLKNGFETERATMRQQMEEYMSRLQVAEGQRDEALNQVRFFEMKMQELEGRLMSGDQSSAQMRSQWEFERVQLKTKLEETQTQLAACEKARLEAVNRVSVLEAKLREAESRLAAAEARIQSLQTRIQQLELEIVNLRNRLNAKSELHTHSSTKETYKVQTFEIACKLAVMDGTDDGMYNGLPIEVEGEGLYRDLVARGRKPKFDGMTQSLTQTTSTETYKVNSYEMAERLSKSDGSDDGFYNGLPIEVVGMGLFNELRKQRGYVVGGGGGGGGFGSATTTSSETYKVDSYEMAEKLSKMDGTDDGLYKGLPIEITGQGLFRDIRRSRGYVVGGSAAGGGSLAGYTTSGQTGGVTVSGGGGGGGVAVSGTTGGETYIVTSKEIAASLSRMGPNDDGTYKGLPIEIKGMGLYRDLRAR